MAEAGRRSGSRADRRRRDTGSPTGKERRRLEVPRVKIDYRSEADGIVLALTNPLVVSNNFAVRDQLMIYCERFTARRITVDLSGVPYADTTGIGILAELHGACLRQGKQFVLRSPTDRVREVLEIFHLDRSMRVEQ